MNRENYNKLIEQMEKLLIKLHELDFMSDKDGIKIQMSKATNFSISMNTISHYQKGCELFNKLMGFDIETDDNLKEWEVNVKFQDTFIDNPDGTTTRLVNYINLNNIDKLKDPWGERVHYLRRRF
ncbi:hypothetical protein LI014_02475 [Clostridium perfringens]|uniref:hypothetical protein n=1 Tax=Clostridium perfringens TaxID=1502 RepID=UPI0022469B52|nr:hypothetical protein [Clostridium perfringens]MCX0396251.1 hypothetical protein [Clostridium perfringens]